MFMTDSPAVTTAPVVEIQATPVEPAPPAPISKTAHKPWKKAGQGGISNLVGLIVTIADIDSALERTKGDRGRAAKMLNLETRRLNYAVNQNKALKARWRKYTLRNGLKEKIEDGAKLPDASNEIAHRNIVTVEPGSPSALQSEVDLAAELEKEDRRIKEGLTLMGCTQEETQLAISLRGFHGRHISKTVDMMTAGLSLNALRMLGILRELESRIKAGGFSLTEKGEPAEEAMVREAYRGLLEEYRQTTQLCLNGSLIAAKIDSMKRADAKGAIPKGGKPGFKPKGDTNIIAQNVTLKP